MNRWAVAAKNAPLILRGIYEYNIASRFGPLPAREWLFPLTYRCDARCVMCNIWQSGKGSELSLEEWDQVLNDRLFAGIESVALSGGEPTLHPHLPQLAGLLLNRLPSLRRVTITTNGLNTERVVRQCAGLLELCAKQGIGLFAGISLDGLGEVHDRMRNIPEAFAKVQNTVQELQSLRTHGLRLGISCTLTSRNLHDAENVGHWTEERGLPVNYIVASFADSYYDN
ncbi:MAG: radical SAM protein, partial [Chloroflexi bacterium]|nr:radical SAM protein [Chloroflexota bacterium]